MATVARRSGRAPRFGEHEGPVNVKVQELFRQTDNLVAATHGRGIYRTRPLSTVYVDWRASGPEDGSPANPYDTVMEGINAAGHGTTISIADGYYIEVPISFYKAGRVVPTGGTVRIQ